MLEEEIKNKRPSYHFAKRHGIVVDGIEKGKAKVYYLESSPIEALAETQRLLDCPMELIKVEADAFQQQLAKAYQNSSNIVDAAVGMEKDIDLGSLADQLPSSEDLLDNQDDAPVIRLINAVFTQAIKQDASDIHIETYENQVLVRYRIDGVLQQVLEIQRAIAPLIISRIKVMAKLDIAEKRIPQDGRIAIRIGGHNIDIRVSTLPSNHGERIVMRILDKQSAQLDMNLLGMAPETLTKLKKIIQQPHGILLITGPTGSGKTTSLYAMLTELNEVSRNILTIEDPIEYDLPGIGQTQVNTKVEMSFAKGLRAILRQDPDVVMIGEIRDLETAEIAIQASLTGHLVLSTLHTNSALGALTRLRDMGVESFLLSTSLVGLMAQRLVRRLCQHCKEAVAATKDEKALLGIPTESKQNIFEPKGCDHCSQSGYKGRTGIYELIPINEAMRGMIHRQESLQEIEKKIRADVPSIRQDGFAKVLAGETSLAEIIRVTNQD